MLGRVHSMYVAVMGYGVVGSGVVELIRKNHDAIAKKSNSAELNVKYILDLRDFPDDINADKFTKDFYQILNDDDVKVVVECMGGLHPAYEYTLACLNAGKSVVTSNKELVATKGIDLINIAKEKNVNFLFEASVGGAIPIIRPIFTCLAANQINEIAGILNGTTNFILTKMFSENMAFDDALKLAQEKGYAEKDPTDDIEGIDACRKICILAALCFGKHVYPDEVFTEGITKISVEDTEYAKNWGGVIKLLGRAKMLENGKISIMVSPAFVQQHSQIAGVDDVFNSILIRGDAIGDVVFYGRGAGKMPTASAVVADVIDCAKHLKKRKELSWEESTLNYVEDYNNVPTSLYVRLHTENADETIADINETFKNAKFLSRNNAPVNELAFITDIAPEGELNAKLNSLSGIEINSTIRVTDY